MIVFFDDRPQGAYGAKQTMLALASGLSSRGWQVSVLTTAEGAFTAAAGEREVPWETVHLSSRLSSFDRSLLQGGLAAWVLRGFALLVATWRLHRRVAGLEASVVVVSSIRSALQTSLVRATGTEVIWYVQIDESFGFLSRLAGRIVSTRIGLSEGVAPAAAGLDAVVPLGVDLERFVANPSRGSAPHGPLVVACIGGFFRRKGFATAVEAVAEASKRLERPVRLKLVGGVTGEADQEYRTEVIQLAQALDVDVEMTGHTDRVWSELVEVDILLHLATAEGMPRVILEAMAAGIPVIAYSVGGIRDTITPECGRVVEVGDLPGAVDELVGLAVDNELRTRLGAAACARVLEQHSLDAMVRGIERFLPTADD